MAEQIVRNYVAVTVDSDPRFFVLGEEDMPRKSLDTGLIFHSWLRAGASGVVGLKFSSWMIKQGKLTPTERSVVSRWNLSESDFEVFFGPGREYDHNEAQEDETGAAHMLRLDSKTLAICFPLYGSTLQKGDTEALAASLATWSRQERALESGKE
jgi:hypothetical protein